MCSISPYARMDSFRFIRKVFFMLNTSIIECCMGRVPAGGQAPVQRKLVCGNQAPIRLSISPYADMDLTRFFSTIFFIIALPPKVSVKDSCRSAADAVEHLAVIGHGLNQVLQHNVLHNSITSKSEW